MGFFNKTISYCKRNGLVATWHMINQRLSENHSLKGYEARRIAMLPGEEELEKQRQSRFEKGLRISIVIPAYETRREHLAMLLESILCQTYSDFEICIADASTSSTVSETVSACGDKRIIYKQLSENMGISGNTNVALDMAGGDIVCLMDHDDFVEPDALYHIARAFLDDNVSIVYTDEDKAQQTKDGIRYFQPNEKPDYNKDMFLSNNYICHIFAVRASIAKAVRFREEFDGAQDYDFILRCIEKAESLNKGIVHIPRILYHWRVHSLSTADNPESKLYAYDAGLRALEEYINRNALHARVYHTEHRGFYGIEYLNEIVEDESFSWSIPAGGVLGEDIKRKMLSYFARNDVRAVCGRLIDRHHRVVSGPYAGMKDWDSGIMHRAHLIQNVEMPSGFYVEKAGREGGLVIYDPNISIIM